MKTAIKSGIKNLFRSFGVEVRKAKPFNEVSKKKYATVPSTSNIDGVFLDVRNPDEQTKYLEVGDDSLVTGKFVFETTNARVKIGSRTFIGGGLFICIDGIEIGDDVMFSWGCTIMDNDAHSVQWKHRKDDVIQWKKGLEEHMLGKFKNWDHVKRGKITIKDKAWIGFDAIILKGVTIGEGAVVAAGSVVVKDIPDWTIVAGNPAQPIRLIPENER
jgi:acetyltransferase-like isoleucine patch superfamily enzyme